MASHCRSNLGQLSGIPLDFLADWFAVKRAKCYWENFAMLIQNIRTAVERILDGDALVLAIAVFLMGLVVVLAYLGRHDQRDL